VSKGKIYKVSGALRDSLENRLRKLGYVDGKDIPNINRINRTDEGHGFTTYGNLVKALKKSADSWYRNYCCNDIKIYQH
jgi:hypothetical protein